MSQTEPGKSTCLRSRTVFLEQHKFILTREVKIGEESVLRGKSVFKSILEWNWLMEENEWH